MTKFKLTFLFLLACGAMFAQSVQTIYFYSGTKIIYVCTANSVQPRSNGSGVVTVTAASNASPVSFTAAAHGFDYQSGATVLPVVQISGGTGNWTAINGEWVATPTGTGTFTIAVDSTAFGALTGTLVVTTSSPRTTEAVWNIVHFVYDGSNNLIFRGTGFAPAGLGGSGPRGPSAAYNQICANRAALSYQ